VEPLRLSQVSRQGDATRLASFELVIQGLDADIAGEPRRAQGSYERAVQVDPTNPYAFLALARYHLDAGDSTQAIFLVDQAAALFESEGLHSPALGIHLIGLRGGGLRATGLESDGVLYLKRAEALAPGVWGDGFLSAEELK
jgi:tetratricopeptide (TPR) repeat protein